MKNKNKIIKYNLKPIDINEPERDKPKTKTPIIRYCDNCKQAVWITKRNDKEYCIRCNNITKRIEEVIRNRKSEDSKNSLDKYRAKLSASSRFVGVSPHARAQHTGKPKEWRSGWNWKARRYVQKVGFKNSWNIYSDLKLSDYLRLAAICDQYNIELSKHILETIAKQIQRELKLRKDITSYRARTSPKYRIGKYTYYLTPLKQKNGELRDIAI